jgi:hypothetical protein
MWKAHTPQRKQVGENKNGKENRRCKNKQSIGNS